MDKLKITHRLYISTAAFLILIAALAYFFVESVQNNVTFAKQEKDGNAYQRPLTSILYHLGDYQVLSKQNAPLDQITETINSDFDALKKVNDELGEALQFTPEGLASRKREHLNVTEVERKWQSLHNTHDQSRTDGIASLAADIRGMTAHAGDTSNLILDPDLDSYYLMDVTLITLPQTLDRFIAISGMGFKLLAKNLPLGDDEKFELLRLASMLKEGDVDRAVADFSTAFNEDINFYGASPTFKAKVEPKLQEYKEANEALIAALQAMAKSERMITSTDWQKIVQRASSSAMALWATSTDELDVLLGLRITHYQQHILFVLAVLAAGLIVATVFFYFVIRGIRVPLADVQYAMVTIGDGDFDYAVPHLSKRDEIGDMAKALQVFKETSLKAKALAEQQKIEQTKKEERQRKVDGEIRSFQDVAAKSIETVTGAATQLEATSNGMVKIVADADGKASTVADATSQTSANVQTVAAAAEELSSSIREIATQITKSSDGTKAAMQEVLRGEQFAAKLSAAVTEIGNVSDLIDSIAGQINLLALNATIESARAGEAGKGFAVVAVEVKNLATRTSKATEDITQQIGNVQAIATEMVTIIASIKRVVNSVNEYSSTIAAAIEEQNAVTSEIAKNMQVAASGVNSISTNIVDVKSATNQADTAMKEVLKASNMLSRQAETLNLEIKNFLANLQAA